MKFQKEKLKDLVSYCVPEGFELVSDDITDTTRWSVLHYVVFKFDGKFYATGYSEGATEYQDESPFEYEPDEIECKEVFPVEKTITVYE